MSERVIKDHLKALVERIERLEEEKKAIADDIRDVYAEAKATGFDVKALRAIVKLRKIDADERAEQEAILETYMAALGMLDGDAPARSHADSGIAREDGRKRPDAQACAVRSERRASAPSPRSSRGEGSAPVGRVVTGEGQVSRQHSPSPVHRTPETEPPSPREERGEGKCGAVGAAMRKPEPKGQSP